MLHAGKIFVLLLLIAQLATGSRALHFCPGEAHHHSHGDSEAPADQGHLHVGAGHGHSEAGQRGCEHGHADGRRGQHGPAAGDGLGVVGQTVTANHYHPHHLTDCAILAGKAAEAPARICLAVHPAPTDGDGPAGLVSWLLSHTDTSLMLVQFPRPPDRDFEPTAGRLRLALISLLLI